MKRGFLTILLVLTAAIPAQGRQGFPPASFSQPVQSLRSVDMVVLDAVDTEALRAEDETATAAGTGGPARFAAAIPVALDADGDGTWEALPDGGRLWRLRVVSPGALSLNFGFSRFRLPDGAAVHFYAAASAPGQPGGGHSGFVGPDDSRDAASGGASVKVGTAWDGPYEAADASPDGQFWTAVIPGDDAMIELRVPAVVPFEPELALAQVGHDYRGFGGLSRALLDPEKKQGNCNIDVICREGDPWRSEIRSVGCYSFGGNRMCTGTLVNSHDPAHPAYFLTASHCGVVNANAQSMVVYWNFDSPVCDSLGGGSLTQHQSGGEFKASHPASDFCLVRLVQTPSPAFNVYYAGWDAREATRPASAVCIHHPNCDEKAISFCTTPLTITGYLQNTVPGDGTHWRITKWNDGTTEQGSSGSGLWSPDHRIVGQLHGGYASCQAIAESDWFGRLSRSWEGGGVAGSRLRTWLDPTGTGGLFIDGRNWDGGTAMQGDANIDGAVNTQDLGAIAKHILGTQLISGQGFLNVDLNQDGRLSVVDLVNVVNIILQGGSLAGGIGDAPGVGLGAKDGMTDPGRATIPRETAGVVQLEASFDPVSRAVVFTLAPPAPLAATDRATGRSAGPAAISLVLAADPGAFAPGLLPVRLPVGGGWQGLAMAAADGTVRAVLYDSGAGASGPLPSFALPVTGQAGEVRWAGGDAADGSASFLPLETTGLPMRIGPSDDRRTPTRVSLVVQPNPARGACVLRFDPSVASEAAFTLYDPAGRLVLSRNLGRVTAGVVTAELSGRDTGALAPGLYFVRLTLDGTVAGTARLIVAR